MRALFVAAVIGLLIVAVTAETCNGNCPGGRCPNCPCGRSPAHQDAASWCAKFGGWDQRCCQCIIQHESGGNANAMNFNDNGSFDVGLWQINKINWGVCGGAPPCDTEANFQCAKAVWKWGGNSFRLWSTAKGCGC
mmetsp:Transcript_23363/g.27084  ORF Transcript_23363/g.27084 Transcript_23363/m.27084 type:complete len:136 (+) Transcript_23363:85-492(+)